MKVAEHLLPLLRVRDSALFRKVVACTFQVEGRGGIIGGGIIAGGRHAAGDGGGGNGRDGGGRDGSSSSSSSSSSAAAATSSLSASQLAAFDHPAVSSMMVSALRLVGFFCELVQQKASFRPTDSYMQDFNLYVLVLLLSLLLSWRLQSHAIAVY